MDLNAGMLVSGAIISLIGLALFINGKKMQEFRNLGIGLAMMTFPIFVHSILMMWLIAVGCIAGLYLLPRST
ncbi:MAG: hypothetical protein ACYTF9_06595 [Planctomycetota bacterium]|jgi:hypothetical protein